MSKETSTGITAEEQSVVDQLNAIGSTVLNTQRIGSKLRLVITAPPTFVRGAMRLRRKAGSKGTERIMVAPFKGVYLEWLALAPATAEVVNG